MFDRLKKLWKKSQPSPKQKAPVDSIRRSFSIIRRTSLKPVELQQIENLEQLMDTANIPEAEELIKKYWAKILLDHEELSVHEFQERLEYYAKDLRHHYIHRGKSLEIERKKRLSLLKRKKKKTRGNNDSCGNNKASTETLHPTTTTAKTPEEQKPKDKNEESEEDDSNSESEHDKDEDDDDDELNDDNKNIEETDEQLQPSERKRTSVDIPLPSTETSIDIPIHRKLYCVLVDGTKDSYRVVDHACQMMNYSEDHILLLATFNNQLPAMLLSGRTTSYPQNSILILKHALWNTCANVLKRYETHLRQKYSEQLDYSLLVQGTADPKKTLATLVNRYKITHIVAAQESINNAISNHNTNHHNNNNNHSEYFDTVLDYNLLKGINRAKIVAV